MTHETFWVPAYTLKVLLRQHPALPCGSGVVLPYQHHRDSVQKGAACTHRETNPRQPPSGKNSICGCCCRQKWPRSHNGMASCLGVQCRRIPHAPSLWCWQVVLAKPSLHPELTQPGPQLPRGAKVLETHMALVMYYGPSTSCSPLPAHGAKSHFL